MLVATCVKADGAVGGCRSPHAAVDTVTVAFPDRFCAASKAITDISELSPQLALVPEDVVALDGDVIRGRIPGDANEGLRSAGDSHVARRGRRLAVPSRRGSASDGYQNRQRNKGEDGSGGKHRALGGGSGHSPRVLGRYSELPRPPIG